MNLHQLASGAIGSVNPYENATLRQSDGYEIVDFVQVPKYKEDVTVSCQIQPVSQDDIKYIEGLNLQGIYASVYCNGHFSSLNRPDEKGGDLFVYQGKTWLIIKVVEWWPDWCHFIIQEQLNG